ncbi:MAG: nucleoside transporter [Planctomycetia bacterium]|nr:nucleoside transporter [Planctomycetia bacterium]
MAGPRPARGVLERLDRLNEFEREPIAEDNLHGGGYFAGIFAGEHVAATEFVIGALFINFGASTYDVVVGLIWGNLLAVLSWALVCAPIAVQTRLTLYWYLRAIGGPVLMVIYNVLNAILFCVLAGAMITVSASAVRIPFGIASQTNWYPDDARFVLVVLGVGAVVVTLAILGFKRLAQFAAICSPWMLLMFVAGALVTLPLLGDIRGFGDFWRLADKYIWTGPAPGQTEAIGFWHIVAFAWICNLAMHLGMSDMALFRYARRWQYGFISAVGMYLGHYLAWICAGIMGASVATVLRVSLTELDSGEVAYAALGASGALTVVIAGWTTANPTLYRAGLALQVVTPGWPRWAVTLAAGAVTTVIACFPFVFTKLLDFVGLYGLLLMPVGTIVVVEHWVFPRIGLGRFWASRKGLALNWPALAAWLIPLAAAMLCWRLGLIHLFFLAGPAWLVTAVLYIAFSAMAGAGGPLPELDEPPREPLPAAADGERKTTGRWTPLACFAGLVALICLALCVILPAWVFLSPGEAHLERWMTVKRELIGITVLYFVSGIVWIQQHQRTTR